VPNVLSALAEASAETAIMVLMAIICALPASAASSWVSFDGGEPTRRAYHPDFTGCRFWYRPYH
jgi:hypothetical protein